jgi:hypothetical protein
MSRVVGKARVAQGHLRVHLAARGGNTANLMTGIGMQKARSAKGGASRQGGEKPRRRNMIGQVVLLDRRGPPGTWEWTPE